MKDLLGIEVKENDVVTYVKEDKQGRTKAVVGTIKGFNKRGCLLETKNGMLNVKNVLKLKRNFLSNIFDFFK